MKRLLKPLSTVLTVGLIGLSTAAQAACNSAIVSNTSSSRFTSASTDGATIEDEYTQLIWMRCSLGQAWNSTSKSCDDDPAVPDRYTWREALEAAKATEVQGISTWRLPNKKELASLVDYSCVEPAINSDVFPNTESTNYWTSTPQTYASSFSAWAILFSNGNFTNGTLTDLYAVRLVRDPS